MLSASRSLALNISAAPLLPRVPEMQSLYDAGLKARQGEVIMVAGRSGSQKSGFALWLVAQMNLPTLYFSADMTPYQASIRLACSRLGMTTEQVEARFKRDDGRREILAELNELNLHLSFGHIHWSGVDDELLAYVELHNEFPKVMVFDNLMDIEDAQSDYQAQMDAMQAITDLSRHTGATIFVLHHATDKGTEARSDPYSAPPRSEIKGGMSEKPETVLTVGINPNNHLFQVAIVKQRMGKQDPAAKNPARLRVVPEETRFEPWVAKPGVFGSTR